MNFIILNLFFFILAATVESAQNSDDNLKTYQKIVEVIKLSNKPFLSDISEKDDLVNWFSSESSSIWEQVNSFTKEVIAPLNFTSTLISEIQDEVEAISGFLEKGKDLKIKNDFSNFLSKKEKFFPQTISSNDMIFDPNWVVLVIYYMRASSLIHLALMDPNRSKTKRLNKCALHHELELLREDVIGAAKHLYKLRYQHTLKGAGIGNLKDVPEGILLDTSMIPKYKKSSDAQGYLSFIDTFSNDKVSISLPHIKHFYFDLIVRESMTSMIERMVMFYNSLIGSNCDEIMAEVGCQCPKMILSEEVRFAYSDDCYGGVQNRAIKCRLPCLDYDGTNKNICVFGAALETGSWYAEEVSETKREENPDRYSNRAYCNPPSQNDWDQCMNVRSLNKNVLVLSEKSANKQKKIYPKSQKKPPPKSRIGTAVLESLVGGGK
ncbi:uncharacterized protein LOC100203081 isoform X1 [Hydra vulgaris]|uniref:uncharacterized protein LOC100203081 isoform X1 n=1 Tax=Hydra vulgaris TaxID=6087 RepID=UPI001F5F779B|nr:uncharacterized protein LOC100203081 isoform X1 [Hydra vulgaris]